MMKILAFLFLLFSFACQKSKVQTIQLGNWGGDQIRLAVSSDSWYVEFECAHLKVDSHVSVQNSEGEFTHDVQYFQEYGVQFDDPSLYEPKPAKIKGSVDGNKMTLHVEVEGQDFGTFQLEFEKEPVLYKCA
ncbi:hypothetical protein [Jiulongibacter sp. NS-SX5]|uniref:hypothetical protein n=1 Tax=Jiulongibacter sp. NS-SX5 TaxID=3463854 RepID=UPI004059D3EB